MRRVDKKRRKECKTNYHQRLKLLKGGYLRFVFRKTNKYLILQIIKSDDAQDKVLSCVNSKELLKYGWSSEKQFSLKSLNAAYLSGLLLASKSEKYKEKRIILDKGLIPSTKSSRMYASLKGLVDSGMNIAHSNVILPEQEQLENIQKKDNFLNILNKIK